MVTSVASVAMVLSISASLGGNVEGDAVLRGVGVVNKDGAPDVVCVIHWVVFDFHQNRSEGSNGGVDVVIGRIAIDGGKYLRSLF